MSVIPYTRVPNVILDAMQTMSEAESKLTALLCRQTYGYHTNSVRLTWNDIQESCGFSSRSTVAKAIELVEERGFFAAGRRSVWLVNSTESVPNDGSNSTESVPNDGSNSTESVLDYSTQSVPSFKEIKDPNGSKKKNTTPTPPPDPTLAEMVNALVDEAFEDEKQYKEGAIRMSCSFKVTNLTRRINCCTNSGVSQEDFSTGFGSSRNGNNYITSSNYITQLVCFILSRSVNI